METPPKTFEIRELWDLHFKALELGRQLDALIAAAPRSHGGMAALDRLVTARGSHARTIRSLATAAQIKPRPVKRKQLFQAVGTLTPASEQLR
jgi:hypothetical protein